MVLATESTGLVRLGKVEKFTGAGGDLSVVHDEATAAAEGLASPPTAHVGEITLVTGRASEEVLTKIVGGVGYEAHGTRYTGLAACASPQGVTTDRKGKGYGSSEAQEAWREWHRAWVNVEYWLTEAYDEDHLTDAREHRSRLFEAFVMACRRARV